MATASKTLSIYQRLAIAGVPLDHHESDLYAKVTPDSTRLLFQDNPLRIPRPSNAPKASWTERGRRTFKSDVDGALWYEIPFSYDPFWNGQRTIRERFATHGFTLEQTGGNCTAYVWDDGQVEEWVTVDGTHSAPDALTDVCAVACGEKGEDMVAVDTVYTCGDILAALELGDDEYTLLFLKLHNGHHKKGTAGTAK